MRPAALDRLKMILVYGWIFFCSIANNMSFATTLSDEHFNNHHLQQRYEALLQEVRCVVCRQQNLAESEAVLAIDLRHKIFELLKSQQSDEAIKAYLTMRYGDAILLRPPLTPQTLFLWGFPLMGILLVFLTLLRFAKKPVGSTNDVLGCWRDSHEASSPSLHEISEER